MKSHEIYGLPATATTEEINAAAAKHAVECARGMHGSIGPVIVPVPDVPAAIMGTLICQRTQKPGLCDSWIAQFSTTDTRETSMTARQAVFQGPYVLSETSDSAVILTGTMDEIKTHLLRTKFRGTLFVSWAGDLGPVCKTDPPHFGPVGSPGPRMSRQILFV